MKGERRVVVTGIGVATPIGIGTGAFWDGLLSGRIGIGAVKAFDAAGMPVRIAGELPEFSLADTIPKAYRKAAKVMSRDTQIAVVSAYHAVRDAGLITACMIARGESDGPVNVDPTRFGANIGAGLVCADLAELAGALNTAVDESGRFSHKLWGSSGMENLTPLWLLKFLPNMLACHVTIVHDAQANSNTITCGHASSHLAIGEAYRTIARGSADVCMCGGAESNVNPMAMMRNFLLGRLTAESHDDPRAACRPFGRTRTGAVTSEGGGLMILEELEHARARGARIYGEIVGFGASSNTYSWSAPDPSGDGIALSQRQALADAGLKPDAVDLVVAFGPGTKAHDASELAGWTQVFGDKLSRPYAVAIKGAVGDMGAGSGAVDVATGLLALHHRIVPPSANTNDPDPSCALRFVHGEPTPADLNVVVSTAYAMVGSQIASLVIRRFAE